MSFWGIIFIVLMLFALFGGGWGNYDSASGRFGFRAWSGFFILWCCVAILGYLFLGGGAAVVVVR